MIVLAALLGMFAPLLTMNRQDPGVPDVVLARRSSIATLSVLDRRGSVIATATGFRLGTSGLLTNCHVVNGAASVVATFPDGQTVKLDTVIASEPLDDLLLLATPEAARAELARIPALDLASAVPSAGGRIYVAGSPRGLAGTVTEGLFIGVRLDKERSRIQITAAISPGSSGSPVLDPQGRVVGVVSFTLAESQQLNFAIPPDAVRTLNAGSPVALAEWARTLPHDPGTATAKRARDTIAESIRVLATTYVEERQKEAIAAQSKAPSLWQPDGSTAQPTAAPLGRADWLASLKSEATQIASGATIPRHKIREVCGWPVDSSFPELHLFLAGLVSDEARSQLARQVTQLVCTFPDDAESWDMALLVLDALTLTAPQEYEGPANRCRLKLAEIRRDDPFARLEFLQRFDPEWGWDGGSKFPACDPPAVLEGTELERMNNELELLYQLSDPDDSLTLLKELELDQRWNDIPGFLQLKASLLRQSAYNAVRKSIVEREEARSLHHSKYGWRTRNIPGLGPLARREFLDIQPEVLALLRQHKDTLNQALQTLETANAIAVARNKTATAKKESVLAAYTDYPTCVELAFILGENEKALSYWAPVPTDARLANLSITKAMREYTWPESGRKPDMSVALINADRSIEQALRGSRLNARLGRLDVARELLAMAKSMRATRCAALSTEDRVTPTFRDSERGLDAAFAKADSELPPADK